MQVITADSEAIDWFAYEDGELVICFVSGGLYRYENVPSSVYAAMQKAESLGRFFHSEILDRYPYRRIG